MLMTRVGMATLLVSAIVVAAGCGDDGHSRKQEARDTRKIVRAVTNETSADIRSSCGGDGGAGRLVETVCAREKSEVERLLGKDLSMVPAGKRHRAQSTRAFELWQNLSKIGTNDVGYVICAAARLQALWEHDLATVRIPERTITPEPIQRTPDGVYYSVYTNFAKARLVSAETMEIERVKGYLTQLRYMVEDYTNGIDSQYLYHMYRSLDEKARDEVMNRVTTILGRAPRWEKWQRR